jgi:hypothetical protein
MMELERLHAAMDAFLDFMGVALGTREERLLNARQHVLDAIESGVRHGAGLALAMAEATVEVDLTRVDGFLMGEDLRHHEDLVMRYGLVREAVVAHVPAAEVLVRLPLVRVFSLCFALPMAHRRLLYQTSYDEVIGV